jgi:hypothetical protein
MHRPISPVCSVPTLTLVVGSDPSLFSARFPLCKRWHRWGILHTEKFWRENAKLLEGDNFKALKALIALLGSRDAVRTVSVPCCCARSSLAVG